jgi:hypothetical protein
MADSLQQRSVGAGRADIGLSAGTRQAQAYEQHLADDSRWALSEGSRHFEEKSGVHKALRKIARRLDELGIPFAVVGGMALFSHGYRRFTEDVDILVSRSGLKTIHEKLDGLGYVPPFTGSKNLRDTETGVQIEFVVQGGYPGDGKPCPIAFPDPESVSERRNGISFLSLPALVELKLASGMTATGRISDLGDVQKLIKLLDLPADFGKKLDPYVQSKYAELWDAVRGTEKRYMLIWRNKSLTLDATSTDEMIAALRQAADKLEAMRADGVVLESGAGTADDYARLVTTDPKIAKKYGMHAEDEFWTDDEEPDQNKDEAPSD